MGLSIGHFLIVAAVIMLLFGRGKVSLLMGDLGQGLRNFRKGLTDEDPGPQHLPRPNPER